MWFYYCHPGHHSPADPFLAAVTDQDYQLPMGLQDQLWDEESRNPASGKRSPLSLIHPPEVSHPHSLQFHIQPQEGTRPCLLQGGRCYLAGPIGIGPLIRAAGGSPHAPASPKAIASQLGLTRAIAQSLPAPGRLHRSRKSWDLASNLGSNPHPAPCWFF